MLAVATTAMRWLLLGALGALIAVSSASLAPLFEHENKIEGEYIVVMKHDGDLEDLKSDFRDNADMHIQREFRKVFKGFQARLSKLVLRMVRRRFDVAYVEEDMVVETLDVASWGLDRIDQRDLPLDGQANFPGTGKDVNAYIIDTGIFPGNTYFEQRGSVLFDALNDKDEGVDCNGHGTHCAGTIGSNTYGIATEANLYGVKVLNCMGFGSTSAVVAGIDFVAGNHTKPAIASMSLGGGASVAIDRAVNGLVDSGVLVSVAAGNDNNDACLYSPARAAKAITVGATNIDDERASFSNYGECVDIFAPGRDITSTWIGTDDATNTISGTSMACPHVTGAGCVLLGLDSTLIPKQLKTKLVDTSSKDKISDVGDKSPNNLLYIGTDQEKKPMKPKDSIQKYLKFKTKKVASNGILH